jgi:hypothetical protein
MAVQQGIRLLVDGIVKVIVNTKLPKVILTAPSYTGLPPLLQVLNC